MSSTIAFNPTVFMSRAFEKAAAQSATDFSIAVIHALAEKYGFDAKEALEVCQISEISVKKSATRKKGEGKVRVSKTKAEPKPKRVTPAFPLPFCGAPVEGWCLGLRLNHGLHSQCVMEPLKDGAYCKTCQCQADKNASGKPTYGCVADRMECGLLEYRDPKAKKQTLPFANVMSKLNITRETAEAEALKFGLTIPEEHFVERASRRGRPKKDTSASDTESEDGDSKPKKRGRPKKAKKVIAASVGDDLIASLVASAKSSSETPAMVAPTSPKEDVEDDVSSISSAESASSTSKKLKLKVKKTKKPKAPKVKSPEQIAKEQAAAQRKAEKAAKISALQTEFSALAKEAGAEDTEIPTKIGDLTKAIAEFKREAKDLAKALKEEQAKIEAEKAAAAKLEADAVLAAQKNLAELEAAKAMTDMATNDEETVASDLTADDQLEEDDDDDSTNVVTFEHGGVSYWKDGDNNLYDPETQEQVGIWNPETSSVEAIEDFGSDDEGEY